MSKDKSQKVVVKKGAVINRKHNRTVNQDVAHSDPKWESIGHGIFKLKGPNSKTAFVSHKGGKLRSITRKQADVALAPKDAPNV
jgi:hypothetical protein